MPWSAANFQSDPQAGLNAGVYKADISGRAIWLKYGGNPTTGGVFDLTAAWEGEQPVGKASFTAGGKTFIEDVPAAKTGSITQYEVKPNWIDTGGSSSSGGGGASAPKQKKKPEESETRRSQEPEEEEEEEEEEDRPAKKRAAEEDVPEKIVVVTLRVMGARIDSPEDLDIKIVGREGDDDDEASISIRLNKAPAEDKTSVIKSVKTNSSNIEFFKNFADEYVNVVITGTSAATGGKMTITKEFKVPKRIVSDSSYLLEFNFSENAIRQKDSTDGLKAEFGARGAIDFNKKTGQIQYIYYAKDGSLKPDIVDASVSAKGKTYEFFFDKEPLLVPVKIPASDIKGLRQESRQRNSKMLKEAPGAEEHWILLLGKERPRDAGAAARPGEEEAPSTSGRGAESRIVEANIALKYIKFTTENKYVILPNIKLDISSYAFTLAEDKMGVPKDASETTLDINQIDKGVISEDVFNALFRSSPEYKQMSGQFSDNLSPAASRGIVNCWVEGPTVSGYRGVTAREESRYRG